MTPGALKGLLLLSDKRADANSLTFTFIAVEPSWLKAVPEIENIDTASHIDTSILLCTAVCHFAPYRAVMKAFSKCLSGAVNSKMRQIGQAV
jgi:hypothetical protein